jgi:UDPglucose 6-dehydrogenase
MGERRTNNGASRRPKIAVLGMGHVGLPTALGMAELGWEVIGADANSDAITRLQSGTCTFYEPGLQPLLSKHVGKKNFQLTDDVASAISASDVLFICVGTPQKENGEADLTQVEGVARIIARNLNGYKLIVEKSTVPAITGQWIKKTIERFAGAEASSGKTNGHRTANGSAGFDVASNPEFLQEGKAVDDFFRPDRIVIGVESDRARELLEEIYRPLKRPIVVTNLCTAELIKHAANAFLSTKISFINMVSDVCEAVGADVVSVAEGIGLDSRIGPQFLKAGIGFGGSCFPKDVRAFIHLAETQGVNVSLMHEVERVNRERIGIFLKKLRKSLWVLRDKKLAILGLAFKPATDDIREAPALKIIDALLKEGATLQMYDPQGMPNTKSVFPEAAGRVEYCESPYEAARGTHAVLLLTEWDEFRHLDLDQLHEEMEVPIIVDGRNLYDPAVVREHGFEYLCMGRPDSESTGPVAPKRKAQSGSSRKSSMRGVMS